MRRDVKKAEEARRLEAKIRQQQKQDAMLRIAAAVARETWRVPAGSHLEVACGQSLVATVAEAANGAARARLIAAAPDLFRALKTLVGMIGPKAREHWPELDIAEAAIAKAEGRE